MRKIKYIVAVILTAFLAVNITDYIMQERFKYICKEETRIMNENNSLNEENDKYCDNLLSEKELIVKFWDNQIWNFLVVIEKYR